ncbi:MAG: hypothetical protein R2828_08135 [Saprospiraceae bacterium]
MKQLKKLGTFLFVLLILSACTTQKKKGELSAIGKLYHNTTAKYNGYFNAKELMDATFISLNEQHQDNYNKIIPVFAYAEADNPQAVAGDLDAAMEKVSIVVNLHRASIWTDDCYLLIGQAQFLKKDYEASEETLRYLINEYSPKKMSAAKEKSKKGKKGKKKAGSTAGKGKNSVKVEKTGNDKRDRKRYNKQVKKNKKKNSRSNAKKRKKKSSKKATDKAKTAPEKKPDIATENNKPLREEKSDEEAIPAPIPTSISLASSEGGNESDPENYFLKHRPAYQEGLLWLSKVLIARDNYDAALRYMGQLERDPKTFKYIKSELAALQAHYFIKRKDYEQAITQLDLAIEEISNRELKARYSFIKAQIHQKLGQADLAYAAFEKTLKYRPPYAMEFSARLNMAQNAWLSGRGTAEEAKKNLNKMLKDPKNLAFQDQLYYALGQIALKEGNREDAIRFLSLSLKTSRQNQAQKAESYLTLAGLYFEEENYVRAKSYYDSTLQVMPPTDERFGEITAYSNNLTDISTHLQTIALQDSLLAISQLSDSEKERLALNIKQEQDDLKRQQALAKANSASKNTTAGRTVAARGLKPSSFFAYNEKSIRRGEKEFSRVWGTRPLEDDWRRSSRNSGGAFEESVAAAVEENAPSTLEEGDINKLLGGVPQTKNEIETTHLKIREAMYSLGSLFRERLKRNDKTVLVLEDLNQKYPSSNYELDSWYILHIAYKDLNNAPKAQEYFDKIIQKYPTTNYAKLLKDPNFAKEFLDEERRLNLQYDQIYGLFNQGKYQDAYSQAQQAALKLLGKHNLKPKYALLMAMCLGNTNGKDAYINDLKKVIASYPDTEEQKRAKEILRFLGGATAQLPGQEQSDESGFKYEENDLHYVIVVFNEDVKLNDNKITIADYNQKYHKLDRLRITNIYLGPKNETPVLVMRKFNNKNAAMAYFEGVQKNLGDFIDPNTVKYDLLPISQNNYRQVLRAKTLDGYKAFFELNY